MNQRPDPNQQAALFSKGFSQGAKDAKEEKS